MKPTSRVAPAGAHRRGLWMAALAVLAFSPVAARAQLQNIAVDWQGDVGRYSSLAIDAQGAAHIAYHDVDRRDLKYARIDGQGRLVETVDAAGEVGEYCAIAVTQAGVPHISYYDRIRRDLKYAVKVGGSWAVSVVDSTGHLGKHTAIALDSLGSPSIAYQDAGDGSVKLAVRDGGAWTVKRLGPAELVESPSGRSTAIQVEPVGSNPLILLSDLTSRRLLLGIYDRTQGTWGAEIVRDYSSVPQDLALRLDTSGQPHVAHTELTATGWRVSYGAKSCAASGCVTQPTPSQPTGQGTWSFEQVAADGTSVSLALDGSNRPWVAYSAAPGGLMLAHRGTSGWVAEVVDPAWSTGTYASLAIDAGGGTRIAYYASETGDLRYAAAALPPPLDVWLRDCEQDSGSTPATCPRWDASPDIKLVPQTPRTAASIRAQLRNRGYAPASHVAVRFLVAKRASGPAPGLAVALLPIAERLVTVPAAPPTTAVAVPWSPPAALRRAGFCLVVALAHPADPAPPLPSPPLQSNNLAVHCYPGRSP